MKYEFEYGIKTNDYKNAFFDLVISFILLNIMAFLFNFFGNSITEKEIIIISISLVNFVLGCVIRWKKKSYSLYQSHLIIDKDYIEYGSKFGGFKLDWDKISKFHDFEATKYKKHPFIKRFIRVDIKSPSDGKGQRKAINRILLFLANEPRFYFPRDTKDGIDLLPIISEKLNSYN